MPARQIAPQDKEALRAFHRVEQLAVAGSTLHVDEPHADVNKRLIAKSAFYEEMEYALFVAADDTGDAARCGAFLNRRWQRDHASSAGSIGYFASKRGSGVAAREVVHAAEDWLAARGADRVILGMNGAGFHGIGVMTDAFDKSPPFPFPWHPPHFADHIQAAGYERTLPLWVYTIDLTSSEYRERAAAPSPVAIRTIDKRRWRSEMDTMRGMFNSAFRDHWEFHQHTAAEWHEMFGQMKPVIDPNLMAFAEDDGRAVGFSLGMRDLTALFRSFHGTMGPLQIIKLIRGAKKVTAGGLLGIGVDDSQRGRGIARALAARIFGRFEELGAREAWYYLVNDDNKASRSLAESFGGTGRVVYHAFEKPLR